MIDTQGKQVIDFINQQSGKTKPKVAPKPKTDDRPIVKKLADPNWLKQNSTPAPTNGAGKNPPAPAPVTKKKTKVLVAGKQVEVEFERPPSVKDIKEAQEAFLREDHPELGKQYDDLTAKIGTAKPEEKPSLIVQRRNILSKGVADKPKESDSSRPSPLGQAYNAGEAVANFGKMAVERQIDTSLFGSNSPLNSKPVKNVLRKAKDYAKVGENVLGAGQGAKAILGALGQDENSFSGNIIDAAHRPVSTFLNSAGDIVDEKKSPLEKGMASAQMVGSVLGVKDIGAPIKAAMDFGEGAVKSGLLPVTKTVKDLAPNNASFEMPKVQSDLLPATETVSMPAKVGKQTVIGQEPTTPTPNPPVSPKVAGIEAQGQGATPPEIKVGARKSLIEEQRPGGAIAAEALQHYTGPKEAAIKGKELFDSGADMHTLANSLATTPRAIKPEETTALMHHIGKLVDERAGLKAMESNFTPDEYLAHFDKVNNDIQTAYDAIRKGGREASASLNSLRNVLRNDMSMDTGAELVRKVSEKPATADQLKAFQELEIKHGDLQSQLDHVNSRLDDATKEIAALKEGKKTTSTRKAEGKTKFDSGKDEFKALWDQLNSVEDGVTRLGSGMSFTTKEILALSKPAYKMVRGAVDIGLGTAEDVYRYVAKHMSELTGREVTPDHVAEMYDHATGQTTNKRKSLMDLEADIKSGADIRNGYSYTATKRVNLLSKRAQELENEIKLVRSERNKIVRDSASPSTAEKANGFLNTLQLTDPIARGIDFAANGAKLASYAIESGVRKGVIALVNKAGKSALLDPAAGGLFTKTGRNRMQRVFEGYGGSVGERFGSESTHGKYGISTGGGFTNAGYKFAGYSDAPAKELYYRMHLDSQAEALARAELGNKASAEALNARTKFYSRTATRAMKNAAEDFADLQTFNSKSAIQGVSKAIADAGLAHGGKLGQSGGRQFTRFWNVMANVAQDRVERTALGATAGAVNETRKLVTAFKSAGIVDPVAAHKLAGLVAKGSTGAALYQAGKYFQKEYGGFSEIKRNPKGGTAWIDNGVWDQFGGVFSQFTAGANDAEIELNGGDEKDILRFKSNFNMLFSQPMLSQGQNVLNLIGNSDPDKFTKTAASVLGSYFIPSVVRRASKILDSNEEGVSWTDKVMQGRPIDTKPEKVDGKTDKKQVLINEMFKKNIPGLRNQLPTKKIEKNGKGAAASKPRKFQ